VMEKYGVWAGALYFTPDSPKAKLGFIVVYKSQQLNYVSTTFSVESRLMGAELADMFGQPIFQSEAWYLDGPDDPRWFSMKKSGLLRIRGPIADIEKQLGQSSKACKPPPDVEKFTVELLKMHSAKP